MELNFTDNSISHVSAFIFQLRQYDDVEIIMNCYKTAQNDNNVQIKWKKLLAYFCIMISLIFLFISDKTIGRVVLGSFMFARGKELDHWNEMVANQKEQVTHLHSLT